MVPFTLACKGKKCAWTLGYYILQQKEVSKSVEEPLFVQARSLL